MKIVSLAYSEWNMTYYAYRDDGVRLRLKGDFPTHVYRTSPHQEEHGPVEHSRLEYNPVKAVNEWLGFS